MNGSLMITMGLPQKRHAFDLQENGIKQALHCVRQENTYLDDLSEAFLENE